MVGATRGGVRALEAAAFPRLFGTRHLGAIRGVSMAAMVIGTALGPFALAVGHAAAGSYVPVLRWLLLLPAGVTVLGLTADRPSTGSDPTDSSHAP